MKRNRFTFLQTLKPNRFRQVAMGNLMPIATAKMCTLRARRFRISNLPKDPALKAGLPAFLSALLNALKLVSRDGDPIVNTEVHFPPPPLLLSILELSDTQSL